MEIRLKLPFSEISLIFWKSLKLLGLYRVNRKVQTLSWPGCIVLNLMPNKYILSLPPMPWMLIRFTEKDVWGLVLWHPRPEKDWDNFSLIHRTAVSMHLTSRSMGSHRNPDFQDRGFSIWYGFGGTDLPRASDGFARIRFVTRLTFSDGSMIFHNDPIATVKFLRQSPADRHQSDWKLSEVKMRFQLH
jgi:hypothetical protein